MDTPPDARDADPAINLSEQIYTTLRQSLILGQVQPGDAMSIRRLAADFGVSAMPVREALKRLESEMALNGAAKRAYRVPEMSPDEAADLFQIQSVLEGAAAEIAAPLLTPAQIGQLGDFTRTMDAALKVGDLVAYVTANYRFHSAIFEAAGNRSLIAILQGLYARTGPWLRRALTLCDSERDWQNRHMDIVDSLERRDAPRARRLVEEDVGWNVRHYRAG